MPPIEQDPIRRHETNIAALWKALGDMEANQTQIVNHVNQWVAKIQGIDSVAFAALALHGDKKFELNEENAQVFRAGVLAVVEEMGRFRDEQQAKKDKAAEEASKAASKKAEKPLRIAMPRQPKNGIFMPKAASDARTAAKKKAEEDGSSTGDKTE